MVTMLPIVFSQFKDMKHLITPGFIKEDKRFLKNFLTLKEPRYIQLIKVLLLLENILELLFN
jgi:hypothetical protein